MQAIVVLILALLGGPPKGILMDLPPVFTERAHTLAAPNRIVVKFKQPTGRVAAAMMGFPVLREMPGIGYAVLLCPYGKVDESITRLKASGLVETADADHVYFPAYLPNDPMFPGQWNLFDMNVPTVWDGDKGDPGTVIAVCDTGVDYNHEDLAANIWHNANDPVNGIDDDHNGFVDDNLGWNFGYGNNNVMDDYGHGTGCAGINAAVQDNGIGISGVAPHCRIMCVKISNSSGYSYDSMFAPAVVYAADNGAKVLSVSFFGDGVTPALRAACDYAYSKDALIAAAAANFGDIIPLYPAAYDNVIAVAAHGGDDTKAWFSNFGTWVDVSAPGVGIATTSLGGGYTTGFTGTSAAAPNAAGVLGLLRSQYPHETNEQIRHRLEYSAMPIAPVTEGEVCNYGRIDALAALNLAGYLPRSSGAQRILPPEVRWISPVQLPADGGTVEIAGRRFKPGEEPIEVTLGAVPVPVTRLTDARIDVTIPPGVWSDMLSVTTRGGSSGLPLAIGLKGSAKVAAPSDYSFAAVGYGGSGKASDLWSVDGNVVHVPMRSDGTCEVRILVRNLPTTGISYLRAGLTRDFEGLAAGSSGAISLYNFASASYPYGSWETVLSETPTAGKGTVTQVTSGVVSRFVSLEGDLFVKFQCSLGSSDAYVDLDRLWFEWK